MDYTNDLGQYIPDKSDSAEEEEEWLLSLGSKLEINQEMYPAYFKD